MQIAAPFAVMRRSPTLSTKATAEPPTSDGPHEERTPLRRKDEQDRVIDLLY